jgi:diadenosine tetraphosphatase ApaH/serine/threonine PP2A family protein phosphatase
MSNRAVPALLNDIILGFVQGKGYKWRRPAQDDLISLLVQPCAEILSSESIQLELQLELDGDLIVVGDLHGQFDDLIRVFSTLGYPPTRSYLFLGDYVDRGDNSIEIIFLLYGLKVLFPDRVFLLRGNHECEDVCSRYGFKEECRKVFGIDDKIFPAICQSFLNMPVTAVIHRQIFCVHGGLSPGIRTVDEIPRSITKPLDCMKEPIALDLLWSDPRDYVLEFDDSERGVGCLFGKDVLDDFLDKSNLTCMIRAHECCEKGTNTVLQRCLTVFSASDYCNLGNDAAVVIVHRQRQDPENCTITIRVYSNYAITNYRPLLPRWCIDEECNPCLLSVETDLDQRSSCLTNLIL